MWYDHLKYIGTEVNPNGRRLYCIRAIGVDVTKYFLDCVSTTIERKASDASKFVETWHPSIFGNNSCEVGIWYFLLSTTLWLGRILHLF